MSNRNNVLDNLEEQLEMYYMCTGINVAVISELGEERSFHGQRILYCDEYKKRMREDCDCTEVHSKVCKQSVNLGEPYFMLCPLNLLYLAAPLMINNTYNGGLLAGPIVMSTPYHQIHLYNMAESIQMEMYGKLENFLKMIPIVDPIRTNYLGNLLYLVATEQSNIIHYKMQEKKQLQSKINEKIQTYKENALENIDIRERENSLYSKVKQGNYQEARVVLGEFLALMYLMEGGNLETIKARCNELYTLISRASIDGGAPIKDVFAFNMLLTKELDKLKSVEEVSIWMSNALKYYCESTISLLDDKMGEVIKKAIQFICANYKNNIKLSDVAAIVHLNASYFSSLFKKEVGVTFIDFLLDLRIEESKNLLVNTADSVLDIAVSLGFTSQSYFARAFKKKTGKPPKKYRDKHGA